MVFPIKFQILKVLVVLGVLGVVLGGGALPAGAWQSPPSLLPPSGAVAVGTLQEVAPPELIQGLQSEFDVYEPQLRILSPQPDQVFQDTSVEVQLSLRDLPLFQNPLSQLGPHVHLILDNEPYQALYKVDQPLVLTDLAPGTHTLRAFPVRPWHESFKNEGAYAQVTFHVLTSTDHNRPDPQQPLLTYSRPKGAYGAEPILLDFYLTQAPLHVVAQSQAAIADWRIRVTINEQSFLVDQWQPLYLKGFKPGKNWVKLEFIDVDGNVVENQFNNTVRVIDYQPGGQDSLSRLVRGDLTPTEAQALLSADAPLPAPEVPTEPASNPVVEPPSTQASPPLAPAAENSENNEQVTSAAPLTPLPAEAVESKLEESIP